jgi:hypothetical protein
MNATRNGRARKSLAEQIDRLDRTLDGLADALNESVATAVRDAVQGVMAELLADGALRGQLQAAVSPPATTEAPATSAPTRSSVRTHGRYIWNGVVARIHTVCQALRDLAVRTRDVCCRKCGRLAGTCAAAWQRVGAFAVTGWHGVQVARDILVALATALAVAGFVSVAAYYAGPALAVAASGVSAFVTTMAVRTEGWLRRPLRLLGFGAE